MKKSIIFLLTIFISVAAIAQDDILVKTDGTKYYLQIYDGETNEKVLQYENASGWQYKIFTGDYFDGSDKQLWSFEATEMYPGYFSIVNHELTEEYHLMSYNWLAYFSAAENRDPKSDKEMQFKFVKVTDEYYKLITIEKPTDGSLYNIKYTPGADALNVDANGRADFGNVKSDDITPDNMVNMVFKVVEFNPMQLFEESIIRGDELYNSNPDAPEKARYDLFYILEKAREVRVFGTDGEMLAFQTQIDSVVNIFNQSVGLLNVINEARTFIDSIEVSDQVKTSFNALIDQANEFLNSEDIDYDNIEQVEVKIEKAKDVVEAIFAAQIFGETLTEQNSTLGTGLMVSMDTATAVLANDTASLNDYTFAIEHLVSTQTLISEIIVAQELIAATQEFDDAKGTLELVIQEVTAIMNSSGNSVADLDTALKEIQDAIDTFKRALEAGDTPIDLKNADFEDGLADWDVESPTPGAAYPENKGVDGSRSITFWKGADYQMKVSQTIGSIPNGTYMVTCFAQVSADNSIALFAESGENSVVLPIVQEGGLVKRAVEIEVTNGKLQFGIKGNGENNGIPKGNWIVFDQFEVKWKAVVPIQNSGFEDEFEGWTSEASPGVPYLENKGIDGSRSVTCWKGSDYFVRVKQTITGLNNGTYAVSVMTNSPADSLFSVFATSGGETNTQVVLASSEFTKSKVLVVVSDGILEFGVKGAGEDDLVPGGKWIVFDNFEVVRMPDVAVVNNGFDADFAGWEKDADPEGAAYPQNRGIDASRSITCWSGSDYKVSVHQTLSGLYNGTYSVNAIARTSEEAAFVVFGESAGVVETVPVTIVDGDSNIFGKFETLASVTNGTLTFGVRGAGEENLVSAGQWIIFDSFEVKIKSITPVYEVIEPTPVEMLVTDIQPQKLDVEINYWQSNQHLNIESSETIVKCQVYSITGATVKQQDTRTNTLSIPLKSGVFIVRVVTKDGFIDTQKVIIP